MGTHNTTKAHSDIRHAGGFKCRISPILEEDVVEEDCCQLALETASLVATAAVLAHVGITAVADAYTSATYLMS
jgi:hypothetical protein